LAHLLNRNNNGEKHQVWLKKTLYTLSSKLGIMGALYFTVLTSKLADDLGWQYVEINS